MEVRTGMTCPAAFFTPAQEADNWGCAWEDQTGNLSGGAFAPPAGQAHGILKHFLPGAPL